MKVTGHCDRWHALGSSTREVTPGAKALHRARVLEPTNAWSCHGPAFLVAVIIMVCSGCASIGPATIGRDRPSYGQTLADSWKDQMLLNVVKLRYADVPIFLDVATVISQYSREGQIGINSPGWDSPNSVGPPVGIIGGRWTDRPTITYTPLAGDAFSRSLLSPIPPSSVMSLLQAGWPANFVFEVAVRSINGVNSGSRTALFERPRDPEFDALVAALQKLQRDVGISIRVVARGDREVVLIVIPRQLEDELAAARQAVAELLGIDPEAEELSLVYGSAAANDHEVAMLTRSMFEILGEVATHVEVPQSHVAERRVHALPPPTEEQLPIRIHSGADQPKDSYAAVEYRSHWYWIDDTDFRSKRVFTFLMIMLSLAETGTTPGAPLLTVSTVG
jgi:hypothetical protein